MNKTLQVQFICPEGVVFAGTAERVLLDTEAGQIEVWPDHTTLLTTILYSHAVIYNEKSAQEFHIRHGLASVNQLTNTLRVIATVCEKSADIQYASLTEFALQTKERIAGSIGLHEIEVQYLQDQLGSVERMVAVVTPVPAKADTDEQ